MRDELSDQQREALRSDVALIEAGPGSGKTRTVVARMVDRVSKGETVALLSFTKAASNEARKRQHNLEQAPNYIGTLDSFIHRYILTPLWLMNHEAKPRYVDNWDALEPGLSVVRMRNHSDNNKGNFGVPLKYFSRGTEGRVVLQPDEQLNQESRVYLAGARNPDEARQTLTRIAEGRIGNLLDGGIFSCQEARWEARSLLESTVGQAHLKRLRSRFSEITVDEFQDCSNEDLALFEILSDAGINIVGVGDPDQALYEFRGSSLDSYHTYRSKLKPSQVSALSVNYRSGAAICSLANTLRSSGIEKISSSGCDNTPIYLISGAGSTAARNFLNATRDLAIARESSIVVAYSKREAEKAAGATTVKITGQGHMVRILSSLGQLMCARTIAHRKAAVRQFITGTLRIASLPEKTLSSIEDGLAALGVEEYELRAILRALCDQAATWQTPADARTAIITSLEEPLARTGRKLGRIPAVTSKQWDAWVRARSVGDGDLLPHSHIHGVKGLEYEAVMVVMPKGKGMADLLERWRNHVSDEESRVYYVAVTRARRLLALNCDTKDIQSMSDFLHEQRVPFIGPV